MPCSDIEGWAGLHAEIIGKILDQNSLTTERIWRLRQVSRHWASVIRQRVSLQNVSFVGKARSFLNDHKHFQRQHERASPMPLSFKLTIPFSLGELADFLRSLQKQGSQLESSKIEVQLQVQSSLPLIPVYSQQLAQRVANMSRQLFASHGIQIQITLSTRRASVFLRNKLAPPPALLEQLAPFLLHINLCDVPRCLFIRDQQVFFSYFSAFGSKHVDAISSGKALQSLCVSDLTVSGVSMRDSLITCMPRIGLLISLTKLHISTAGSAVMNFQPLSQLTQLTNLALQCATASASCADVIQGNRRTLRHVALTAKSWDLATFYSLGCQGPPMHVFVKVTTLLAAEARALSMLTSSSIQLKLMSKSSPQEYNLNRTLTRLTMTSFAGISQLMLYGISDQNCSCLHTLRRLQHLTLVESPLTGSHFLENQKAVTTLVFVACCNITAAGIKHITTTAFRNLRLLSFRSTTHHDGLKVDCDMVSAVGLGKHLKVIDLRGVNGLTPTCVSMLRAVLSVKCIADAYILCPSENIFKPVLSARSTAVLLSCSGIFGPDLFVRQHSSWIVMRAKEGSQIYADTATGSCVW